MIDWIKSRSSSAWQADEITFGGERVSHLYPNDCYYAHLSIYYFASQFCQGGDVLDAGAGAGYGSVYLAEHGARSVRAIDISKQAVSFSRHYFRRPNLQFQRMDLQGIRNLSGPFDLIFSSNALEHVPEVSAFFHSAWRLLKPDGVMVVAVPPVVDDVSRNANLSNPYHLNIWSPRQWTHVMDAYFEEVQLYRHGFERPDVSLDFGNTPEDTVVTEKDFGFEPIDLERLTKVHTLTIILVARKPRPQGRVPAASAPVAFVDDSFTRPFAAPPVPARRRGWRSLAGRALARLIR